MASLNVQDEDEEPKSIDWIEGVQDWKEVEISDSSGKTEHEEVEVFVCEDRCDDKRVKEAKMRELQNWKKYEVYEEVKDNGQPCISIRWVCTEKLSDSTTPLVKARLVARGFEEHKDCNLRSDAPTAGKDVLRIFLTLVATNKWRCNCIDIKAAFLQGCGFDREVFLRPPKEAEGSEGKIWKLRKCVYGLNDAARVWYFTVKNVLIELGCIQLKVDPAMFYWFQNEKLSGLFLIHVDDFIWGGTQMFKDSVISKLEKKFEIGKQAGSVFKYVGVEINQDETSITLSQKSYLNEVNVIPMSHTRAANKL